MENFIWDEQKVLLNFPLPAKDEHEIKICSHNPVLHTTAMCLPWKLTKAATSICLLPALLYRILPSMWKSPLEFLNCISQLTTGVRSARCVCETISTYQIIELSYLFKITGLTATHNDIMRGSLKVSSVPAHNNKHHTMHPQFQFHFHFECFAIAWDSLVLPPAQRRVIQFISYAFLIVCRLLTARRVSFIERVRRTRGFGSRCIVSIRICGNFFSLLTSDFFFDYVNCLVAWESAVASITQSIDSATGRQWMWLSSEIKLLLVSLAPSSPASQTPRLSS